MNEQSNREKVCAGPRRPNLRTTAELLALVRTGDAFARDELLGRYLSPLRCWAHGLLPCRARGLKDTDDLVQTTLIEVSKQLHRFELRHPGALMAYMRTALKNQIRDEIRRSGRWQAGNKLNDNLPGNGADPEVEFRQWRLFERYEAGLEQLPERARVAVTLRLEFNLNYATIARELEFPSADAARMVIVRAVARLADYLREKGIEPGTD